jgi:hypothetical protein
MSQLLFHTQAGECAFPIEKEFPSLSGSLGELRKILLEIAAIAAYQGENGG